MAKKQTAKPVRSSNEDASAVKKVLLAIAIAIILAFFLGYGVVTFYKENCSDDNYIRYPEKINYTLCSEVESDYSQTQSDCYKDGGRPRFDYDENGCGIMTECNMCYAHYEKTVFILNVILGIICVILGGVVLKHPSVSSGIMSGGILVLIYSTIRYWGLLQDYLRIIILGIVLAILIWMGYKKLNN
ncbi:GRP family sugar transporter [Candidatus Woesearchaeota archaeon]|nr:GRP family sugar transporter [Candidatus Woesearchaeota archaeon]